MLSSNKLHVCLLTALVFSVSSSAERTRWCSPDAAATKGTLLYPPIARAAHISGPVIVRVTYRPSGEVLQVEPASGPHILSQSVVQQLSSWRIGTSAPGDDLCQSLVIAAFALGDDTEEHAIQIADSSSLRVAVSAEPLTISDPSGCLKMRRRIFRPRGWFRHCD
jgi:hypothetical protein